MFDHVLSWEELLVLPDAAFFDFVECYGYRCRHWYKVSLVKGGAKPRWRILWLRWRPVPPMWRVVKTDYRRSVEQIRKLLQQYNVRAQRDFPILVRGWTRLALNGKGPHTIDELAVWMQVDPTEVEEAVAVLEKDKFLTRDGSVLSLVEKDLAKLFP